jgi:hypothetical protein
MGTRNRPTGSLENARRGLRRLGALSILLLGCEATATPARDTARFRFALHHFGSEQSFVAETADPLVIRAARRELERPVAARGDFPSGRIVAGNAGYNGPWSWHLEPSGWELTESAAEACDSIPTLVERDLDYWLMTVGRLCPWDAYVLEEL